MAQSHAGRFVKHLSERRMRVDRALDLVAGGFERHREAELGDEFGSLCADDVRADNLTVRLTIHDLHKPFRFGNGQRLAARGVWELADGVFQALRLRVALGEADGRDLRLAISTAWEGSHFLRLLDLAEHAFHGLDCFVAGNVSEPRRPDDVPLPHTHL